MPGAHLLLDFGQKLTKFTQISLQFQNKSFFRRFHINPNMHKYALSDIQCIVCVIVVMKIAILTCSLSSSEISILFVEICFTSVSVISMCVIVILSTKGGGSFLYTTKVIHLQIGHQMLAIWALLCLANQSHYHFYLLINNINTIFH